ncbi:MAG: sigma factor regulator protein, partial [Pseudomonadota bacterium]
DAIPIFKKVRSPVSVGTFTTSVQIPGRDLVDGKDRKFSAKPFLTRSEAESTQRDIANALKFSPLKDRSSAFIYGPIPQMRPFFRMGHIDYPKENQVYPMYKLGKNQVLPTLSLSGNLDLKINGKSLISGGESIPLLPDGAALINWIPPAKIYEQGSPMASAFAAMASGKRWEQIPQNAHIIIMPLAFTGNSDLQSSPYGVLPGGMIHVSMLNSALTSNWLSQLKGAQYYLMLAVLLTAFLQMIRGVKAWIALFVFVVGIALSSLFAFVNFSVDVPWVTSSLVVGFSGVLNLAVRSLWELRRDALLNDLEVKYERLEIEEKRLSKEMADAGRIALALRPEEAPHWPDYWISAFHKGLDAASGDWYFFERSPSGRYGHFVLCDITGHGVQAALVVSCCKTILSGMRLESREVFESDLFVEMYAKQLNQILYSHGKGTHSTTLLGITIDFQTHTILALDCGHPFPLWHSLSGSRFHPMFAKANDPLGFAPDIELRSERKEMKVGDSLIVHSDGVPLTKSRRILRRYFEELDSGILISAKKLYDAIMRALLKENNQTQFDDVSLVVIRRQA